MEIRPDSKLVHIYHRGKLVRIHRSQRCGGRSTDPDDYPAELSAYAMKAPERIKRSAALHGPAVAQFAQRLFDDRHPWSKIRQGRPPHAESVWVIATRHSGSMPPVAALSTSISST